jgi:hypothetical protein
MYLWIQFFLDQIEPKLNGWELEQRECRISENLRDPVFKNGLPVSGKGLLGGGGL